jgi:uncharacterized Zn-finger protein
MQKDIAMCPLTWEAFCSKPHSLLCSSSTSLFPTGVMFVLMEDTSFWPRAERERIHQISKVDTKINFLLTLLGHYLFAFIKFH